MQNGNAPHTSFLKRVLLALSAVGVLIVVYPTRARPELSVETLWASVPARDTTEAEAAALIAVDFDDGFAYLTSAGRIVHRGRTAYRVALSLDGFVNYSRTPAQLVVQYPNGDFRSTLPVAGYPVFVADRLFVLSDGGGTLSEWDLDGELLWRMDLPAPLLSLDSSSRYLALGPIAGGPIVSHREHDRVDLRLPAHGERSVVYRIVLSEDPDRLAILSGTASSLGGENAAAGSLELLLTIYELSAGRAVPVVRRAIGGPGHDEAFVTLLDDGRALYGLTEPEPMIVGLGPDGTTPEYVLALRYPARAAIEPGELALHAVLSKGGLPDPSRGFLHPAELTYVDRRGRVAVRAAWAADATSISQHRWDGHVPLTAIRIDDRVLALRMEVR